MFCRNRGPVELFYWISHKRGRPTMFTMLRANRMMGNRVVIERPITQHPFLKVLVTLRRSHGCAFDVEMAQYYEETSTCVLLREDLPVILIPRVVLPRDQPAKVGARPIAVVDASDDEFKKSFAALDTRVAPTKKPKVRTTAISVSSGGSSSSSSQGGGGSEPPPPPSPSRHWRLAPARCWWCCARGRC